MRFLLLVMTASLLGFMTIGCEKAKPGDERVKITDGSPAQCKRLFADIDYYESIEDTLTVKEQDEFCKDFKNRHLGIRCVRSTTTVDNKGNKTVQQEEVVVDEKACKVP